jgi:hypothetical protein
MMQCPVQQLSTVAEREIDDAIRGCAHHAWHAVMRTSLCTARLLVRSVTVQQGG